MTIGTRKTDPGRIAQVGERPNHAIPGHPRAPGVDRELQNENEQALEVQRPNPSALSQALTDLSTSS